MRTKRRQQCYSPFLPLGGVSLHAQSADGGDFQEQKVHELREKYLDIERKYLLKEQQCIGLEMKILELTNHAAKRQHLFSQIEQIIDYVMEQYIVLAEGVIQQKPLCLRKVTEIAEELRKYSQAGITINASLQKLGTPKVFDQGHDSFLKYVQSAKKTATQGKEADEPYRKCVSDSEAERDELYRIVLAQAQQIERRLV